MEISKNQKELISLSSSICQSLHSAEVSILYLQRFMVAHSWEPSDETIEKLRYFLNLSEDLKMDANLMEHSSFEEARKQCRS